MKRRLFFVIILGIYINANAQSGNNPGFGNTGALEICEQLAFTTDEEVANLVNKILDYAGVENRNYEIKGCNSISSCYATVKNNQQYIVYQPDYLKSIKSYGFTNTSLPNGDKDWQALTILAHEVGHLINTHFFNCRQDLTLWNKELQADEFAGRIVYQLNGTLDQAKSVYNTSIVPLNGSMSHPPRADRINAVARGYHKAERMFPRSSGTKGEHHNLFIPSKELVLAKLDNYSFISSSPPSLTEAQKMLSFISPDAKIDYSGANSICAVFESGYHLTLWTEAYGRKDYYSARYGMESNHSFRGSNDTYFEIMPDENTGSKVALQKYRPGGEHAFIPSKELILSRLRNYTFNSSSATSLSEATEMLKFISRDARIDYTTTNFVCAEFASGYHLILWTEAYGRKDRYSARFGRESNHSFIKSNDTYFEIIQNVNAGTGMPAR